MPNSPHVQHRRATLTFRRIDDLVLLTQLVEAGSFTAASKATGMPLSRLSRRIAELESELGVRLIERSTRSFRVTDIGLSLYRHGCSIREETLAAYALAKSSVGNLVGSLRIACPAVLAEELIASVAIDFAVKFPEVRLTFNAVGVEPDVWPNGYDIAFVPTNAELPDTVAVARQIMRSPYELVASPGWIEGAGHPSCVDELAGLDGIGWWRNAAKGQWRLCTSDGTIHEIPVRQSFFTNNLSVARGAAQSGLGMARLPRPMCRAAFLAGTLRRVVPGLSPEPVTVHAVYPSRRSLTSVGRAFLELLDQQAARFAQYGEALDSE